MKKLIKTLSLVLALALGVTCLAGCGTTDEEQSALIPTEDLTTVVAATYGDEEITMDEVNFFLRKEQWDFESYAWSWYTQLGYTNPWDAPYDEYKTMGEYIKEMVMTQAYQTRVLNAHAAEYGVELSEADITNIATQSQSDFESFDEVFLEYAPVTVEQLTEWYQANLLANRVHQAVLDSIEVEVTDEETQEYTISYITIATDDAEETADSILEKVAAGSDMDTIAEELELDAQEQSILKVVDETDEDNYNDLYKNTKDLKTGETTKFEIDGTWYAVVCVSELDEDATAEMVTTVTDEKKEAEYETIYEGWVAEGPALSVKSEWEELVVSEGVSIVPEETDAEEVDYDGNDEVETDEVEEVFDDVDDEGESDAIDTETAASEVEETVDTVDETAEETAAQ